MVARSSLLRRVAALAALAPPLAPRLVRLAHHDYPNGLLAPVRTAAVVVTWEGGATTDRCVASILAQDRPAGERHILSLLCLPRTWLRYRPRTLAPYPVTGVMGAALLATRACYQAVGGFAAEIEVYYEDVDFCLAARARGFEIVIEPRAVIYHDGLRGFAGGLTPWAAFLKARNPWLVVRRRGRAAVWLGFVPTYAAMLGGSAALHALRGRGDVVRALARGALAGIGGAAGRRVAPVGPPAGSR